MDRYKTFENQTLFSTNDEKKFNQDVIFLKNLIKDKKSKYSVTCKQVHSKDDVKHFFNFLQKYKFYKKATHNTYAYRIQLDDGSLLEGKNDDGELGGGNCILTVLKRRKLVNCMVIVTRYFGGIHLNNDRFKHLLDATNLLIDSIE